jgi:hypothetical protein
MEYVTYLLTDTKIQIFKENDLTQNELDLIVQKDNNEHNSYKQILSEIQQNYRTKYNKEVTCRSSDVDH